MKAAEDPLTGYLVHFTRGARPLEAAAAFAEPPPRPVSHMALLKWMSDIDSTGYQTSLSILGQGRINATSYPLGVAAHVAEVAETQCAACFSATSLDKLARLIKDRSSYGVGFEPSILAAAGGRPVRYLEPGSEELAQWKAEIRRRRADGPDPKDPFWEDTLFIDSSLKNEWEEEWRVPRGLDFEPDQAAFIFLPQSLHGAASDFFHEHRRNNTGRAYLCRYIDPAWDRVRIKDVLGAPPAATKPNSGAG